MSGMKESGLEEKQTWRDEPSFPVLLAGYLKVASRPQPGAVELHQRQPLAPIPVPRLQEFCEGGPRLSAVEMILFKGQVSTRHVPASSCRPVCRCCTKFYRWRIRRLQVGHVNRPSVLVHQPFECAYWRAGSAWNRGPTLEV